MELTVYQDYFTYYELRPSLDWAKTDDYEEKLPDHPLAEHGLFQMCIKRDWNLQRVELTKYPLIASMDRGMDNIR